MTIIDALIIYLTLGAPISMYRFSATDNRLGFDPVLKAISALLFWPFYLVQIIRNTQLGGSKRQINDRKSQFLITDIRSVEKSLEKAINRAVNAYVPNDHRKLIIETAERYAGLKLAEAHSTNEPVFQDIFEISDHPNAKLAATCLSRKNQIRLKRHISIAENDLINAITLSANASDNAALLIKNAARFALFYGDSRLAHLIRSETLITQETSILIGKDQMSAI